MSNIKSKFRFSESVEISGEGALRVTMPTSGKLVGDVTVDEYDDLGRKIFTDVGYNDITLPGSIFILEQMFKTIKSEDNSVTSADAGSSERFLIPSDAIAKVDYAGSGTISIPNDSITNDDIAKEKIFGFMAGFGGESGGSIVSPKYTDSYLTDGKTATFMPFRKIPNTASITVNDEIENYTLKVNDSNYSYYYAKKLSRDNGVKIHSKWTDGSGNVDDPSEAMSSNTPILTYAECVLEINGKDFREFYGETELAECGINQIGLLAGCPILDPESGEETGEYKDVKMVTCINIKTRDLSNSENTLKITYKIYCL